MGLLDSLGGGLKTAFEQAEGAVLPSLISAALAKTDLGNFQGLLDKLRQSGLGPQVASWLGDGKNLPVNADQLRAALGNTQIAQIAAGYGLPVDSVLATLAEHLPATVDKLSPDGVLHETK